MELVVSVVCWRPSLHHYSLGGGRDGGGPGGPGGARVGGGPGGG